MSDIERLMRNLKESLAAAHREQLDAAARRIGFHGYEDCPNGECPTPYMCSERAACPEAP